MLSILTLIHTNVLADEANGIEEIWAASPEGTGLVLIESYYNSENIADMEAAGLPKELINYIENCPNIILMPDMPSVINGEERWAWYEIEPESNKIISVIDTFEKGAFVDRTIIDLVKGAGQYIVGAFKGIETSIWSVAVFSLETDDYKEILKSAKKLALGIADNFGFKIGVVGAGVGGKPSASASYGGAKASFDGKAKVSQNLLNFKEGYKAGVEYYFSKAE